MPDSISAERMVIMNATKLEMKNEALKRMELLGLKSEALYEFRKNDVVKYSKTENILGQNVTVLKNVNEKMKEYIDLCEEMNGVLVYHAIYTEDKQSEYLTILFVLGEKELWRAERQMIAERSICTFTIDLNRPSGNHIEILWVKKSNGGLIKAI